MPIDDIVDAIPVAQPVLARYESAAQFFEQALQAGARDPQVAELLALAYKRQEKPAEARDALRKIASPDATVFLQMGLLATREQQLPQAEQEFAQASKLDPRSYDACYNLFITRLALGQIYPAFARLRLSREVPPR